MVASGDREDPYSAFQFLLQIDDVTVAGFSEVSWISTDTDIVNYREGAANNGVIQLPSLQKFANITLKRGVTASDKLWRWREGTVDERLDRKSGKLVVLNEAGDAVTKWVFHQGWPSKWVGPAINVKTNEVAIETLKIVCEGLEMEIASLGAPDRHARHPPAHLAALSMKLVNTDNSRRRKTAKNEEGS